MRWTLLTIFLTVVASPAQAADWQDLLSRSGSVAIVRHALAPGTGDPDNFRLNDCRTQRNLDDRGRNQAKALGDRLRKAGITFDRILTSAWCRCEETARLMGVGPVEILPALNSFFSNRQRGPAQTESLRALLNERPENERLLLVTHQVNITALTGRGVSSGDLLVLGDTTVDPVPVAARLLISP